MRYLAILLAVGLAGCGVAVDGRSVVELAEPLAHPPAEATAVCARPVALGDKAMLAGAVERAWAADRSALVDCATRHAIVVEFYNQRDAALASSLPALRPARNARSSVSRNIRRNR